MGDIRAAVDIGRAVSRADTDGGLAGRIRRLHHTRAAGGENQPHRLRLHQLLTAVQRRDAQTRHRVGGRARRLRRFRYDLRRFPGAGNGLGVRRKHDGVARFQGDHGLVAHRGGGVGAGDDGGDDPHRHADLPELFLRDFPENAHGLHAPNRLRHPLGGEEILSPFVLRIAEARLLNRHFRQRGRLCRKGFGHRLHDGVQLALGQFCQLPLRCLRPARQLPRFLPRGQILVKFHRNLLTGTSPATRLRIPAKTADLIRRPLSLSAVRSPRSPSFPASAEIRGWPSCP